MAESIFESLQDVTRNIFLQVQDSVVGWMLPGLISSSHGGPSSPGPSSTKDSRGNPTTPSPGVRKDPSAPKDPSSSEKLHNKEDICPSIVRKRSLCLKGVETARLVESDRNLRMLPLWTFGIGWLIGLMPMRALLEDLYARAIGQQGDAEECDAIFPECFQPQEPNTLFPARSQLRQREELVVGSEYGPDILVPGVPLSQEMVETQVDSKTSGNFLFSKQSELQERAGLGRVPTSDIHEDGKFPKWVKIEIHDSESATQEESSSTYEELLSNETQKKITSAISISDLKDEEPGNETLVQDLLFLESKLPVSESPIYVPKDSIPLKPTIMLRKHKVTHEKPLEHSFPQSKRGVSPSPSTELTSGATPSWTKKHSIQTPSWIDHHFEMTSFGTGQNTSVSPTTNNVTLLKEFKDYFARLSHIFSNPNSSSAAQSDWSHVTGDAWLRKRRSFFDLHEIIEGRLK
ncbi:uncharacterized protein LOC125177702 [Hyalella azteca]|uniref:Uncharacterized protein LOC125177702 n=1 Tax=Hyalella azteca TaxID=294128 RepID=A0A979FG51_HYAAZ|nr:uncharacterized protein LOC125177702 [Hyalella azteca]